MSTITRKASNLLVTGTCASLGVLHFLFQSSADVVSDLEAGLIKRRDGLEPEAVKMERMYKTVERQQHILNKVEAFKATIKEAKDRLQGKEVEQSVQIEFVTAETILTQQQ